MPSRGNMCDSLSRTLARLVKRGHLLKYKPADSRRLEAELDDRAASELHDLADARLGDYSRQSAVACLNDAVGVYFCFCLLLFLGLFA